MYSMVLAQELAEDKSRENAPNSKLVSTKMAFSLALELAPTVPFSIKYQVCEILNTAILFQLI